MTRYRIVTSLLWLSALLLVLWTLLQMPLQAIVDTVRNLTFLQWAMFLALNISFVLVLTQRWRGLINMQRQQLSMAQVFLIRQAGQCISFITPGPQFGGEPFQLYWLWKRCSLPLYKGFLALALDRFIELWVNFAILLGASFYLFSTTTDATGTAQWTRMTLALLLPLIGLSALLWILLRRPGLFTGFLRSIVSRWRLSPRLSRFSELGVSQWQDLLQEWRRVLQEQRPALVEALGLSLLGWCIVLAELWLLLSFVGVQPSAADFAMVFLTIRMAMLLPLPAGIGTIEAGILWTFQSLGWDAAAAMGLIGLMRLRDVSILLLGGTCLKLLGITAPGDNLPSKSSSPTA